MDIFHRDIKCLLAAHFDLRSIVRLGRTCKHLKKEILDSDELWYSWIISTWPFGLVPSYKGINQYSIQWKSLLINSPPGLLHKYVCTYLCREHLQARLNLPSSSKEYLGFFIEIKSNDYRVPPIILTANTMEFDGNLNVTFTHKDGCFLFWRGEGGIVITGAAGYAVDRRNMPTRVPLDSISTKWHESILSRKNYTTIGTIVHKDPNFYVSAATTNYNWDNSHAYQRSGNAPTGFASSTNNLIMPKVAVTVFSGVTLTFDLIQLYERFCKWKSI